MKKVTTFLIFVTWLLPSISVAQTSLLQDKSGETSILINDKQSVLINAGDGSISANLSFMKPEWFFGTTVKLKSTEGISKILDGYQFNPQFDFSLFGGKTIKSKSESVIQFMFYGLKINTEKFNLLKPDNSNTFQEKQFYGGSICGGYNRIGALNIFQSKDGLQSSYLIGVSVDYCLTNNIDDLKSVQTYTTVFSASGNVQTALMSNKKSGFSGEYLSYSAFRCNVDAYIYPQIIGGWIGIGGYFRSQFTGSHPRTSAGAGIIIGQKNAPSNVVFGLLYQFNDIFNQLKAGNNFLKRGGINIVAGYNF